MKTKSKSESMYKVGTEVEIPLTMEGRSVWHKGVIVGVYAHFIRVKFQINGYTIFESYPLDTKFGRDAEDEKFGS